MKVLNDFSEQPLLKSFQDSKYVTLFQDETTDISNHSESVVFAMFSHNGVHKEHYMGIVHMDEGLTAEKFYISTLNLFKQKNLNLSKVQFVDYMDVIQIVADSKVFISTSITIILTVFTKFATLTPWLSSSSTWLWTAGSGQSQMRTS